MREAVCSFIHALERAQTSLNNLTKQSNSIFGEIWKQNLIFLYADHVNSVVMATGSLIMLTLHLNFTKRDQSGAVGRRLLLERPVSADGVNILIL